MPHPLKVSLPSDQTFKRESVEAIPVQPSFTALLCKCHHSHLLVIKIPQPLEVARITTLN